MGRLTCIELHNFKSYRGTCTVPLGDTYFTSIIGPNGSGKSNMMDAISFVLGVRSAHLRSSHMKDLIYRGRADAAAPHSDPQSAYVAATYEKSSGDILQLKRSISANGATEYRINGSAVSATDYATVLKQENILIKARNFLVFQGDVEAIAAQSPSDLARLIEHISGSNEFKREYDELKDQQERAHEATTFAFSRKRSYGTELKQYKEQQQEVEEFQAKIEARNREIEQHMLWKLFHADQRLKTARKEMEKEVAAAKEGQKRARKEEKRFTVEQSRYSEHSLAVQKLERSIKKRERQLAELRNELVPVRAKIELTERMAAQSARKAEKLSVEAGKQRAACKQYATQLRHIEEAEREFEQSAAEKLAEMGSIRLTVAQQEKYRDLRAEFDARAADLKSQLNTARKQLLTAESRVEYAETAAKEAETRRTELAEEISEASKARELAQTELSAALAQLADLRAQLTQRQHRQQQLAIQEVEINEKLAETLSQLLDVAAAQRETEKERRLRENVAALKRLLPGVRGLLHDLCRPKSKKYATAVAVILGKSFDAVVVDTSATAQKCIAYLKEQRAGTASFIPLDSVRVSPVSSSLRTLRPDVRPVLDVVEYDTADERAVQYACGSAVVCDTLAAAKELRWGQRVAVKAVAVDGSLIHKSGLMTGGQARGGGAAGRWEKSRAAGLGKLKDELLAKLQAVQREKAGDGADARLSEAVAACEARLPGLREAVARAERLGADKTREAEFLATEAPSRAKELKAAMAALKEAQQTVAQVEEALGRIEAEVFADLCAEAGLASIREYEDSQGRVEREFAEQRRAFAAQRARLERQRDLEAERATETERRQAKLETAAARDMQAMQGLKAEAEALEAEVAQLSVALEELKAAEAEATENLTAEAAQLGVAQEALNPLHREVEEHKRRAVAAQEEAAKQQADMVNTLRNCRRENISVPLLPESRGEIPLAGETDGDDEAVMAALETILPDFSALRPELRADGSESVEAELVATVAQLTAELDQMAPNLKAGARLEDVEHKLHDTERDFAQMRRDEEAVRARFAEVKSRRTELFMTAFRHIAEKIDPIYKELTKSKASPVGGSAYLTLEDEDEPYLAGVKYHAMPPMKRFRDMEQLSGGEKTMAAMALLFAIHSFHPSPFFVLDEVDAALDNANVAKIANYIVNNAGPGFQFIVISLKSRLFENSQSLVGVYREQEQNRSRTLTLDLRQYAEE